MWLGGRKRLFDGDYKENFEKCILDNKIDVDSGCFLTYSNSIELFETVALFATGCPNLLFTTYLTLAIWQEVHLCVTLLKCSSPLL
jgi:hypothetical protein